MFDMTDEEWDSYEKAKDKSRRQTEESLKSLEGKTIKSIKMNPSGAEYYARVIIECTDGSKVAIESCHGDTTYFTDLYARISKE